jgi:nucleotide-binding universal stress UspA family protein
VGRVLVTIPTRDVDGEAVQEALALLGPEHELIFLTVHPIPAGIADDGIGAPMVLSEETWDELDEGARELGGRELRETLDKLGLQGTIRIETGDPGERIYAVAVDEKADLIVMGSHHSGALRRLLGGSIADDVTHHAPCPVLLIRHKETAS